MKEYKYNYTYLITNTKENRYYIGVKSCDCLPEENTDYMGSSELLTEDIVLIGQEHFTKIILETFDSREEAEMHERNLHIEYEVHVNDQFYNRKLGQVGFHVTDESVANMTATKNSEKWKETIGKEAGKKISDLRNDTTWKESIGKLAIDRYRKTVNDPEWLMTKGKERSAKMKAVKADPSWKEEVGVPAVKKMMALRATDKWQEEVGIPAIAQFIETTNDPAWLATTGKAKAQKIRAKRLDPDWKATVGKAALEKHRKTKANPTWIKNNTFVCEHCEKSMVGKANYVRWHGDKCKFKKVP